MPVPACAGVEVRLGGRDGSSVQVQTTKGFCSLSCDMRYRQISEMERISQTPPK